MRNIFHFGLNDMFYIVTYDIPEDKRRLKIAKTMKDFGTRVQYSVFECLLPQAQIDKMHKLLSRLILPEEDSIRIYRLCANCEKEIKVIGLGKVTEDRDVYIV